MHELYLAESLIEEIEKYLEKEGASKVYSVTVSMGELSGVEREPLEFAFGLASEGRATEKAALIIEKVQLKILCGSCGAESIPELHFIKCGKCGSINVSIVAGREFLIKSMEIE